MFAFMGVAFIPGILSERKMRDVDGQPDS